MKIRSVGAELLHADRRTDGQTDIDEAKSRANKNVNAADGITGCVRPSAWASQPNFLSLGSGL